MNMKKFFDAIFPNGVPVTDQHQREACVIRQNAIKDSDKPAYTVFTTRKNGPNFKWCAKTGDVTQV